MKPIQFPQVNKVLTPPGANLEEECGVLPIHCDGQVCTSLWYLSDEELEMIKENRAIVLSIFSGKTQHPVVLNVCSEKVDPNYTQPEPEPQSEILVPDTTIVGLDGKPVSPKEEQLPLPPVDDIIIGDGKKSNNAEE